MPRTFGDGLVHSSHIDVLVEGDEALNEIPPTSLTPEIQEIAKLIADNLVEDGATIQTGMIMHKKFIPLINCGIISERIPKFCSKNMLTKKNL